MIRGRFNYESIPSMKTIPLDDAITILATCTAVYVDGSYVTFPNILADDEENGDHFLALAREEGGKEERFAYTPVNATPRVTKNGEIVLINTLGQETTIMPLVCDPVIISSNV